MNGLTERRAAPSLLGPGAAAAPEPGGAASLLDLMHEGFYLLFMLKNGALPPAEPVFMERVTQFLRGFEHEARKVRAAESDIGAAQYAFCATFDEIMLNCAGAAGKGWARRPLQLALFGDQLAGEHFFDRLEHLRSQGRHLQALQVFHMCLLLGFQGKYALDGGEKLSYLTARLGDEIAHLKGRSRGFAPRAAQPDRIVHRRRNNLPLWVLSALFALAGALAYLGLETSLTRSSMNSLAPYADLIKLAPRPAHLSITLP